MEVRRRRSVISVGQRVGQPQCIPLGFAARTKLHAEPGLEGHQLLPNKLLAAPTLYNGCDVGAAAAAAQAASC